MKKKRKAKEPTGKQQNISHHTKIKRRSIEIEIYKKRRRRSLATKKRKEIRKRKRKRLVKEICIATLLGILVSCAISFFFFSIVGMKGYSMSPIFRDGDQLLIQKTTAIKRFDLIAFSIGGKVQVRRVIGLPGEKIEYRQDTLYVNDQPVDEKFLINEINESQKNGKNFTEDFTSTQLIGSSQIAENYYLVLGDNRPYATDSRYYGIMPKKNIIGRVSMLLLPLTDLQMY